MNYLHISLIAVVVLNYGISSKSDAASPPPLVCYTCSDATTCATVMQCNAGELCMTKTKTSSVDGHKEYSLKCASTYECDGESVFSIVGRRKISERNLHITCCSTNLCNSHVPPDTTTVSHFTSPTTAKATTTFAMTPYTGPTRCRKDVTVFVQGKPYSSFEAQHIKDTLSGLIDHVPVSSHELQLSLTTFDFLAKIQKLWNMNTYHTQHSLLNAIGGLHHFLGHDTLIDVELLYHYIQYNAFQHNYGDRRLIPNVSVIFIDSHSLTIFDLNHVRNVTSSDVIVVVMGPNSINTHLKVVTDLAQRPNNVFYVGYSSLLSLTRPLIDAICT